MTLKSANSLKFLERIFYTKVKIESLRVELFSSAEEVDSSSSKVFQVHHLLFTFFCNRSFTARRDWWKTHSHRIENRGRRQATAAFISPLYTERYRMNTYVECRHARLKYRLFFICQLCTASLFNSSFNECTAKTAISSMIHFFNIANYEMRKFLRPTKSLRSNFQDSVWLKWISYLEVNLQFAVLRIFY